MLILYYRMNIYNIIKKNPFEEAYDEALKSGAHLAYLIQKEEFFGKHGFNLIGYSLGTLVIYYCLLELEKMECYNKINDVVFMGSVLNSNEFRDLNLKSISGNLINCYSEKDNVLKSRFKPSRIGKSPVGLMEIEKKHPKIININCSDIVFEHFDYQKKMNLILRRIDFNSDFHARD
jgi:hypothetical protein